jgi:Xaa-Pro aminopeptidase
MVEAGVTGRRIQIELEAACFRHGADRTAFDTIVATGPESAVLHSSPSTRVVQPGDAVLIDAGASVRRYASDVTRTYRAPGGDGAFFQDLYAVVLEVERRAIERCTPGTEWREAHLEAATGIVEGLIALGLMRGNPSALVESGAHTLFFPHGLGHLVGLGVRDASGRAPGRPPNRAPALANLRCDLPLQAGYAITVEPGIYFIPPLLGDPELRARHRGAIAWDRVERWAGFGGIRIEDDVVVTNGAPEVLTAAIPKRAG